MSSNTIKISIVLCSIFLFNYFSVIQAIHKHFVWVDILFTDFIPVEVLLMKIFVREHFLEFIFCFISITFKISDLKIQFRLSNVKKV